ncbi:MAG: hypothetical protein Kow0047_19260 [Anaerolineae bacterium]
MAMLAVARARWIEALAPRSERIAASEARQRAVWEGTSEYTPLIMGAPLTEVQEAALPPAVPLDQEYLSHEHTLTNGLRQVAALLNSDCDATPCIRPNMGTGICATVFGCRQVTFPDKMPWVTQHMPLTTLDDFDVDAAPLGPDMEMAIERARYLAEVLHGTGITPYCFDTQGPFSLAHLVIGNEIFFALYDEPERVHRLLDQCVRLIIRVTRLYKEVTREPVDGGRHSGFLTMRGGIRVCEDTATLLNADQIAEFVLPYTRRLLAAFGGGWIHYCGRNDHLYRAVMDEMPEAYGINFGNPEKHDMGAVVRDCIERGKVYVGEIPQAPEENLEAYFRRVLSYTGYSGRGLILQCGQRADAREAIRLWRRLQGVEG